MGPAPGRIRRAISSAAVALLVGLVWLYRALLSPLLHALSPGSGGCRFTPSCSEYAIASLRHYGPVAGTIRAARRILRCHPFHPGGYDPPVREP